ncbi:hypothetical protein QAD02_015592 [Eretmocerus hayati]|uniref:Uncharacterized protein n=1 Tax=Eretmocerus hayati TaxID=131215 RepID=A0ACC2P8S9_9HYME|nr:hypothetical protein QAD02_015592 [Eretmocerus hayati]
MVVDSRKFLAKSEEKTMGVDSRKSSTKSDEIRKKGNNLFRLNNRDDDRMVLSLYTESIAYAPLGSEELAQAYSNRSALWLYLHKYDLSLLDIERALKITKSSNLVSKLSARKEKCLNNVVPSEVKESQSPPQLPNISTSEHVHFKTDSVVMNWSKTYGRHFIASRDIEPGEIIMCEKSPYASVDVDQMYLVCAHCLAFAWSGIPCDTCVLTIYCSEECKKEAWSEYHDIMCALFSNDCFSERLLQYKYMHEKLNPDYNSLASSVFMILVRMIIIMIKREGLDTIMKAASEIDNINDDSSPRLPLETMNCSDFEFVYNLTSTREQLHEGVLDLIPLLMVAFKNLSNIGCENSLNEMIPQMESVADNLYKICESNSFQFSVHDCLCKDSDGNFCISTRGGFFSPCGSFFNHSCDNNVNRIFVPGPRVMFFANRSIKQGEQLFINYGYSSSIAKNLRQRMLARSYSFTCQCTACIEDWPVRLSDGVTPGAKLMDSKLVEMLGEYATNFFKERMVYNEILYDASIEMLKFIYENSRGKEASDHAYYYERYLTLHLSQLYGENIDLQHTRSVRMMLEQHSRLY